MSAGQQRATCSTSFCTRCWGGLGFEASLVGWGRAQVDLSCPLLESLVALTLSSLTRQYLKKR